MRRPENGSVAFEVCADRVRRHGNPVLTGGGDAISVSLPLSGRRELHLVTDGGDGAACGHVERSLARLTCP